MQFDLISFTEEFYNHNISIMRRKNADYTAKSDDPFANFTALNRVSGIPGCTEIGFLNRMQDKFMRLCAFVKSGSLEVKDESVIDTLADLANYSAIFAAYLHNKSIETGQAGQ
jgi:hypothetical protein